jgi:hypothetical protein
MVAVAGEAHEAIKDCFRNRAAQEARTVVEEWKESQVYPYEGEATTRIEQAERQGTRCRATGMSREVRTVC